MPLYNFQPQFVAKILDGKKRQTIRAKRKLQTKVGDPLHLYTGLRHAGAQKLMTAICTKIEDIEIDEAGAIRIDGRRLTKDQRQGLAWDDGFRSFSDMLSFWTGRLPFRGDIIHWTPPADGGPA